MTKSDETSNEKREPRECNCYYEMIHNEGVSTRYIERSAYDELAAELEQWKTDSYIRGHAFEEIFKELTEAKAEIKRLFDRVVTAEGSCETYQKNEGFFEHQLQQAKTEISSLKTAAKLDQEEYAELHKEFEQANETIAALRSEVERLNKQLWHQSKHHGEMMDFWKSEMLRVSKMIPPLSQTSDEFVGDILKQRDQWRDMALRLGLAAKECRIYCLGSDVSTVNMIERFDKAMSEFAAFQKGLEK